jgi:hypothetical protein
MLAKYQKFSQASWVYHLGIFIRTFQDITLSDTLIENLITNSHLCKI